MKSISTRLTLWYALAVSLSALVFMLFGRLLIEKSYIEGIDQLNDKEFEEISNRIDPLLPVTNIDAVLEAVEHHAELDAALFFFQLGTTHQNPIFLSANLGGEALPDTIHQARRTTIIHPELGRLRVGDYQIAGLDVNIASSLNGLEGLFRNLYRIGLGSLLIVFIFSLGIGRILSRIALRPVTVMQETASRISVSNLSERIHVSNTSDEIGQLGNFLNTMLERLERSFGETRKFTADASHELRTPLSLIRLSSEKLRSLMPESDLEKIQLLDNQLEMIDQLNKVVDDLLVLAQADAGTLRLSMKRVDISDLLNDFAEDAEALCENAGLAFELSNASELQLSGDEVWLRHVLFNLIGNAIKFSPRGGCIRLTSENDSEHWQLQLSDEGPGIPDDKLETVFQRFYNESDPGGGKGSGLGLSLCRGIIRLHGGRIWLSNKSGNKGLVVHILLPLLKDD